ncbi:MAG: DUF2868 domain-containing protein [Halothiobacillaceae bacterium]|nr:MAG: DUF2868 domain-containing protein [Halothiobacillaceae bacterium]
MASRSASRPLSRFESHWLAEVVRQHESRSGPLGDASILADIRAAAPNPEQMILKRAELLGRQQGWRDALLEWRGHARATLAILALIALISGFASSVALMGASDRPVNVIWVLGGLLGVHLLSLLLWLAGLLAGHPAGTRGTRALLGRAWYWLSDRLGGRASREAGLGSSYALLLTRHRLMRWLTGSISHMLWSVALLGALAGLWVTLATQRYGFIWETTILPAEVFVSLTHVLGIVPAWLGFSVPDANMVRASGAVPLQDDAARQAWSSWLLGCVIAYGLLPRLLLTLGCLAAGQAGMHRMRLDMTLPGYAPLKARLQPSSQSIGVVDRDPGKPRGPRLAPHPAHGSGPGLMVGLELGADLDWPPAAAMQAKAWPRVESRQDRQRLLAELDRHPPARLLVALDARLSPDRGSLRFLAELAGRTEQMQVWLRQPPQTVADRGGLWREALIELGLPPEAIEQHARQAIDWLETAHD